MYLSVHYFNDEDRIENRIEYNNNETTTFPPNNIEVQDTNLSYFNVSDYAYRIFGSKDVVKIQLILKYSRSQFILLFDLLGS